MTKYTTYILGSRFLVSSDSFGVKTPGFAKRLLPGMECAPARGVEHKTSFNISIAPKEQLEQLKQMAEDRSPTRDSLRAVSLSSKLVIE